MIIKLVKSYFFGLKSRSGFAFDTSLVVLATLAAQILPLLFYPILTRIYSPAEFGTFATVILFATPLAIVASGVYEQAFLLNRSERASFQLFQFIVRRSLIVLTIAFLILLVLRAEIAKLFNDPGLNGMLLLIPIISLGQVIYVCSSEWLVRGKAFAALGVNRIWQSAALSLSKTALGFGPFTGSGLVVGEAFARCLYMMYSFAKIWRKPLQDFGWASDRRRRAMGRRFRQFPRIMVPDQLINTLSGSIHIVFIGAAFGPTELGYVSLLFSALYLPVTVVSSSIKDVFRQRASVDYAQNGNCRPIYLKLLTPVTLLGLIGFGLLYAVSPWIFVIAFGPEWAALGGYAQILIPMFFFNFIGMSLGGVLVIANQMKASLWWQCTNLAMATLALLVGIFILENVPGTLFLFSIARSVSYLHNMLLSYKYARRPDSVSIG